MPNWCEDKLVISGKKNDVTLFFKKVGFDETKTDLRTFLEQTKLTMRSWLPMPQTFIDFDTTNQKKNRDAQNYNAKPIEEILDENGKLVSRKFPPLFASDEEYEKYSKGFDDAVNYQAKTYGCVGWYDYNCQTLGCKWDAQISEYGCDLIESGDEVTITFDFMTAWSAPTQWIETLIKEFPELTFTLDGYEPGMCFHTHMFGEKGSVVDYFNEDYEVEYDEDEEED